MAPNDLTSAIEQSHAALGAILKGDPSLYQALYSLAEDVTLGKPFGPYVRGRQKVEATLAGAASHYRDGEATDVELIAKYVSDNLACVVEVERGRSKVGGAEEVVPVALRVTSVFRLESGSWKLVHRHADPITSPRPAARLSAGSTSANGLYRASTLYKFGLATGCSGRSAARPAAEPER